MNPAPPSDNEPIQEGAVDPSQCTVRISREGRDPEWDSFLTTCPGGHHEQTSLWAEVKGFYGWQSFRMIVTGKGRILGGAQVLTREFRRWGRIGYVTRGPVSASHDPALVELILRQLEGVAVNERLAYLAVVPPYNGQVFEPSLMRLGFREKPDVLPPSGLMAATLVLDLSPDLDSVMARMRTTTRRHIRGAIRKGVTVREGTAPDVETFRRLMWALCDRRGTSPTPPQKDFFEHLWKAYQPSGFVRLFIAEFEGKPISAGLAFPFGDTVQMWKVGWTGEHPEVTPNELLWWEGIRWARNNDYRFFDFVSIDTDLARRLQQGDPVDWNSVEGTSNFKVGFGGTPVLLPKSYYRFYHPILRAFARLGGSKIIESPSVTSLLGRFWNRRASSGEG
jgi:peptidoglycan pentaglycine glycine transferase (the first glycine)